MNIEDFIKETQKEHTEEDMIKARAIVDKVQNEERDVTLEEYTELLELITIDESMLEDEGEAGFWFSYGDSLDIWIKEPNEWLQGGE